MIFATLGWVGTALYLGNHAYLSLHSNHKPILYFAINFVAACALIISSSAINSWQAAATNSFWAIVSFVAFANISLRIRLRLSEHLIVTIIAVSGLAGIAYSATDFSAGMTALGWAAAALFCAAYLLFITGDIRRARFMLYNIIAALALMPILFLHGNWPVFGLEIAWVALSFFGWTQAQDKGDGGIKS